MKNSHWKIQVNAAEIYSQLFHRQLADTDTLSFFIDGMIDEHPQLRVEYSRIVTQNLIALKDMHPRNSKMIVPCNSETISAILKPFGDIVNVLFHDPNIGYLCWSKDLKLSMSSGQSLMKVENDIFTLLYDKFSDGSFWKTLVKFYSEERGAGLDLFSTRNADFFKRIFYFCDRKTVLPYIIALCDGDDSFRQLAASEMLAGMIRSVSNEPLDERNHYMSIFKEIIWNCMANSTTQSQLYWGELLNFISKKRDPRCVWPIIERFFVGFSASDISQSFAQDSKRLFAMHVLLKAFNWRLGDVVDRCFMETLNIISSPFEQIRELAARILHTCIHIASNPGYLNVDELLKAKTIESSKSLELQQLLLTSYLKDNGKSSQKTVYCWFAYMLQSSKNIANFPVNEFLGSVLEFGDDQDADLQLMSLALSKMYPNLLHSDEMTQKLVDKLGTIIFSSNVGKKDWQKKIRCLNIIQVAYFRNVHVFSNEDQLKLLKYVLLMLQDANADVKRLASITLSGLVRCSLRGRVNELLAEFRRKLTANSKTAGFNISERQGIMLGFSSLVSAFPYQVPDWMPGVLIEMARYASNPSAVSGIVCSTFAEFKRTHQDSWEIDKRAFTEEQLYTISEFLLPTSYYA
jgi:proteasome activator subunit 4